MEVTFADGYKDTLVLEHYNAFPNSENIDHTRLCNYLGHLLHEKDARVAVTGCLDDTRNTDGKMYISLLSRRSPLQKSFSMDLNGNVKPIKITESNDAYMSSKNEVISRQSGPFIEGDAIGETDIEAAAAASTTDGVPFKIKVNIKIGTDTAAINKITNELGRTVDDWLAEMFTHFQNHYNHATLQHNLNFEVPTFNYSLLSALSSIY